MQLENTIYRNHSMKYPVKFVSLGPGDAELMTLKSLRALNEADIIIAPSTVNEQGNENSRATNLIRTAGCSTPVETFVLPMSRKRDAAMAVYEQIYKRAKTLYNEEKRVAIAVEGDAGIYASVHYVLEQMEKENIQTEQLPGIPSFIAAGALAHLHLISQNERLVVAPGNMTVREIEDFVDNNYCVTAMKLKSNMMAIRECMNLHPEYEVHYFENVGTTDAFYTKDKESIKMRDIPYFSLAIIRKKE